MDTTRSAKMAEEFLARGQPFKRKVQSYKRRYSTAPKAVFPQLCPTREADWIDGWIADLIYTESGYAELDCILTTPENNVLGAGLWIGFDRSRALYVAMSVLLGVGAFFAVRQAFVGEAAFWPSARRRRSPPYMFC